MFIGLIQVGWLRCLNDGWIVTLLQVHTVAHVSAGGCVSTSYDLSSRLDTTVPLCNVFRARQKGLSQMKSTSSNTGRSLATLLQLVILVVTFSSGPNEIFDCWDQCPHGSV